MRATLLSVACVAAVLATANHAHAGILPYGVHNDVAVDTVINDWGWEIIYQGDYSAGGQPLSGGVPISTVFNGVSAGDYVMLAGRRDGLLTFDVLAAGLFEDVTQVTAQNTTHSSNGVEWYYNSLSMGFAGPGDSIIQSSADIAGQTERDRLSWHTNSTAGRAGGTAPSFVWGGWRSGNNVWLNDATYFDKVVLRLTSPPSPVPEPSSLALFAIGASVAGIGAVRRRRREKQRETTG